MEASLNGHFGRINLGATKLTIGRAPNNQLVLNHSQVSGYHAEIRPDVQGYSIIDFGSTNGTFVNEYRLTPNVPRSLNPNDRLRFGQPTNNPGTTFTFEVQGIAPVEPTDSKIPPLSANSSSPQQAYQHPRPPANPTYPPPQQGNRINAQSRPSIRDIVAGQVNYTPSAGMSEKDLANLLAPLTQLSGNSFFLSMKAGEALGKAMGMKSSKQLQKIFPGPYQYATAVLACILAIRHMGREIISLFDTPRGSVIEIKLPVDVISFAGTLTIEIIDESPSRIVLNGTTEIQGQKFDWGKGKRALEQVFESTEQYLRRLTT